MPRQKYARLVLILCILAAGFYNSWPLGYILNYQTVRNSLVSDLERVGQPYYWLFILGDILTGVCLIAACYLIRFKLYPKIHLGAWRILYIGVLLFGFGTIIATLVPARCSVAAHVVCGTNGGARLGLDALFSGIGALGLFASLLSACILSMRCKLNPGLIQTSWIVLISWSVGGILFSVFALTSGKAAEAQLVQQVFLGLCGLAFVVIGLNVARALNGRIAKGSAS